MCCLHIIITFKCILPSFFFVCLFVSVFSSSVTLRSVFWAMVSYCWCFETFGFHEVKMSAARTTSNFEGQGICLAPQSKLRVMGCPSSRVPLPWFYSSLVDSGSFTDSDVPLSGWKHEWLRVKISLYGRDEVWHNGCIAPRILKTWS